MNIWSFLNYFNIFEDWGDHEKMSGKLLLVIDAIRAIIKQPITLSSPAYTNNGHASSSKHYKGEAIDAYIRRGIFTPFEILSNTVKALDKLQIHTYGLGYYPFWQDKKSVGIHFDVRDSLLYWISPRQGEYSYFATKEQFLDAVKYYKEGS